MDTHLGFATLAHQVPAAVREQVSELVLRHAAAQAALHRVAQLAEDWTARAETPHHPVGTVHELSLALAPVGEDAFAHLGGAVLVRAGGQLPIEVPRAALLRWDHQVAPLITPLVDAVSTLMQELQTLGESDQAEAAGEPAVARDAYNDIDFPVLTSASRAIRRLLDVIDQRVCQEADLVNRPDPACSGCGGRGTVHGCEQPPVRDCGRLTEATDCDGIQPCPCVGDPDRRFDAPAQAAPAATVTDGRR